MYSSAAHKNKSHANNNNNLRFCYELKPNFIIVIQSIRCECEKLEHIVKCIKCKCLIWAQRIQQQFSATENKRIKCILFRFNANKKRSPAFSRDSLPMATKTPAAGIKSELVAPTYAAAYNI